MDHDSLSLLEKAIELFSSSGREGERQFDGVHLEDHALLDVWLIRDCLEKHGLLDG